MEEGMARGQRRFFEVDPHAVDGRSEETAPMSTIFDDTLKCLFQLDHSNSCLNLCDGGLLSLEIEIIGSLVFRGRFAYAYGPAYICAVSIDNGVDINHQQIASL
jgi:hypothetical protein